MPESPSTPPPSPPRSTSGLPQPPASSTGQRAGAPHSPPIGPPSATPAPNVEYCYRHPSREAGRRCTRCGKPACGECLVQASVGSHCVECAKAAQPDLRTRARYWSAGKPAIVTSTIIAINVIVFFGLGLAYDLGGMIAGRMTDAHVLYGLNEVFLEGITRPYELPSGDVRITDGNEWYRLITAGFLHFGIIHLGMNMYFLYILGNQMEPMLGRVKYVALFTASLLGGSAGALLIDSGGITAGASGAVFGLLGAYAIGIWQHGVNPLSTQIGTLLLINLFLTFAIRNISIGGHIGGLVAGALCGYVMLAPGYKGYPNWSKVAVPLAVSALAIVTSIYAVA